MATLWIYIHNVKSGNHNVDDTIHNVIQKKGENIQNIASNIMNGNTVDAPHNSDLFKKLCISLKLLLTN